MIPPFNEQPVNTKGCCTRLSKHPFALPQFPKKGKVSRHWQGESGGSGRRVLRRPEESYMFPFKQLQTFFLPLFILLYLFVGGDISPAQPPVFWHRFWLWAA